MTRNFGALAASAVAFAFILYACTSGEVVQGPATGTAGTTGTGNTTGTAGTTGTGNTTGSSGSTGAGNQVGSGGSTGAGNTTGRGGTTGTGNTTGRGGTTGTGNTVGSAGTTGTGNTTGAAGTTGTGNTTGSAGTTGTGGSTASCPPTFDVASNGFVQAQGPSACWHGYAFTYTETPNCGSTASPMNFAACTSPCNLTATGSVAAATMATNYCGVVGVGFNIGQDASATSGSNVTPKGTGVNVTFSDTATSNEMRVNLVDSSNMAWCYSVPAATVSSGSVMIPYTSFKYQCWSGGTGTPYAMQPFASIAIQALGGAAAASYTMTLKTVKEY